MPHEAFLNFAKSLKQFGVLCAMTILAKFRWNLINLDTLFIHLNGTKTPKKYLEFLASKDFNSFRIPLQQ